MRIPNPFPYRNEAEAVVAEAWALEEETRAQTHWLLRYLAEEGREDDDPDDGPDEDLGRWEPGYDRYLQLREAAKDVVEIAWAIQDPARESPYADLGAAIIGDARKVLTVVREYQPWVRLEEPKA